MDWDWSRTVRIEALGSDAYREECSRVLVPGKNLVLVFGGSLCNRGSAVGSGRRTPQAACLLYDLNTRGYSTLATAGIPPPPLYGHTACVVEGLMYIIGGRNHKTEELNSTCYVLNLETMKWSIPLFAGDGPSGRYGHSCVAFENQLFVFGGRMSEQELHRDIFVLDCAGKRWVKLPNGPPLAYHAAAMLGETMLVYGGENEQGTSCEVYLFDCLEAEWSLEQMISEDSTTKPSYRQKHSTLAFNQRLLIIGGYRKRDGMVVPDDSVVSIAVEGDTLRWEERQAKGAATFKDHNSFLVSDGEQYVILVMSDSGIHMLTTDVPLPTTNGQPLTLPNRSPSGGTRRALRLVKRKKKVKATSSDSMGVSVAADSSTMSLAELRSQADTVIAKYEMNANKEKPIRLSGQEFTALMTLIRSERKNSEAMVATMDEVRGVVERTSDLSACAERQQKKLARQSHILDGKIEDIKEEITLLTTMVGEFIPDPDQHALAVAQVETIKSELSSTAESIRHACQLTEMPRVGRLPETFYSPRNSPRHSPSSMPAPSLVAVPTSPLASPKSPRGAIISPRNSGDTLRKNSLLLSLSGHDTQTHQMDRRDSTGEDGNSPRKKSLKLAPSTGTMRNLHTKRNLMHELSSIQDPAKTKAAELLIKEVGSESPKLTTHSHAVYILEAHAAAAGVVRNKKVNKVPAVPPRAGRRSLILEPECFEIPKLARQMFTRANTSNAIEICRALKEMGANQQPSEQYKMVVDEIVNTEMQFLSDLLALTAVFANPMKEKGIISDEEAQLLFSNADVLLTDCKNLLALITAEAKLAPEKQDFGKIFVSAHSSHLQNFPSYCQNLLLARRTRNRLNRTNEEFRDFLKTTEHNQVQQLQDLKSYTIKPLQRLCKYPLLLKELHKSCQEHQKESLSTALDSIKMFVSDVNTEMLNNEVLEPLYELQDAMYPALDGRIPLIAVKGRRLVSTCPVLQLVVSKNGKKIRPFPVTLYILSDVILICKEVKTKQLLLSVMQVNSTQAEVATDETEAALKARSYNFVLVLNNMQAGSVFIAFSDPTELASVRHALASLQ